MAPISLETRYIHYLDESHFKGYAEQLFFDDEKEYYKGMFKYLSMGLEPEIVQADEDAYKKIVEVQRKNSWAAIYKTVTV